jgi:hypothetical protein
VATRDDPPRRRVAEVMVARLKGLHGSGWAVVGAALLLLGASFLLRLPTFTYSGPPDVDQFKFHVLGHIGAYSDVSALYLRDGGPYHLVPYFDYPFEYPVLTGGFVWLLSAITGDVSAYFALSAVVLVGCGLVTVALLTKLKGSNPWLFALSPGLALYGLINWDLFAIALLVGALWLYQRDRDVAATVLLALATCAKFFPLLLLPIVLLRTGLRRGWRAAGVLAAIFAGVTVAINVPVALRLSNGLALRDGWTYFFTYNRDRHHEVNIWSIGGLSTDQINLLSALLVAGGLIAILMVMRRTHRIAGVVPFLPACAALLAWFFFTNKVYSPQYGLWILVLAAAIALRPALVIAFAGVDILYFVTTFSHAYVITLEKARLGQGAGAAAWLFDEVVVPSGLLREAVILVIAGACAWAVYRPRPGGIVGTPVADPEPAA